MRKVFLATIGFNFLLASLVGCSATSSEKDWQLPHIPTVEEVGQQLLPAEILPVEAPFSTLKFMKPSFPTDTVFLSLVANELNTLRINQAITALSERGGGVVVVPAGEWRTGRVELKSNVNLHVPEEAALNFSSWVKDYQPAVFTRNEGVELMSMGSCVYANGQDNIAITGNGRLIGPGSEEGDIIERIERSSVIENVISANMPVAERIYDGNQPSGTIFPPMFISPINCTRVYIEGVNLSHTVFWNIVPVYCDNVIIRGVSVQSVGVSRGDGIDIESTKNVLIEYCTLSCGDDCFTMKAGRGEDGIRVNKATENVVVRYCLAREGHGGITVGSETAGWVKNLYVHDCVFDNTGVGVRFKTRRSRAGGGDNLIYERIRMNLNATAFKFDMLGQPLYVGKLAKRLPALPVNELTPAYKNVIAKDFLIEKCTHFVNVIGIPEMPMTNLVLENMQVDEASRGIFKSADLDGAHLKNIRITSPAKELIFLDSRNVLFENMKVNHADSALVQVRIDGDLSDNIKVEDCAGIQSVGVSSNN
ncbi:MAG: glycoside hydrolase family 28 protein [Mangrovibacterium sp.]